MPVQDEGRSQKKQPGNTVQPRGRASGGCLPLKAKMGKRLVSNPVILVPGLINFEGLGASLNTRERSRVDVYFPPFPFKDNFIKSLCFHSGSNMGHLNGKVIILPCLLMVRRESGKGGMPIRGRGWQLRAGTHVRVHTNTLQTGLHNQAPTHSSLDHHPEPLTLTHIVYPQKDMPCPHTLPNVGSSVLASLEHPPS